MKKTKSILAASALALIVLVTACKKKTDDPVPATVDKDTSGASDNSMAENTSNDILSMASQAGDKTSGSMTGFRESESSILSCATITRDTVAHTVTITFNGGTCMDGRTRSGSIMLDYSASPAGAKHYRDPGFTCTVTSNNYVVDGNQVTIVNKTITNTTSLSFDPATTNETWHITANISVVKANNGGTVTWTCDRVKTLLNTSATFHGPNDPIDWANARIGITGTASGTRANNETFTVTITSQLIRDFGGCSVSGRRPFIQGTLDFAPANKPVRHIDYGTGTCDLDATVTINNVVYNITI